jgi:hypothetical protein
MKKWTKNWTFLWDLWDNMKWAVEWGWDAVEWGLAVVGWLWDIGKFLWLLAKPFGWLADLFK